MEASVLLLSQLPARLSRAHLAVCSHRPSPIFLMFTALFNAPSGIAAMVIGFANLSNGCKEPLHVFLLVQVGGLPGHAATAQVSSACLLAIAFYH